ncbi:hypothetical protein [Halomonas faecis]|uniref:hypothetical protein n=1 Tax=Halomonas faecis TaxID=1562110 RepID=UPI0013D00E74|nr:hypothetical protein [Halomonas faecis]
MSANTDHPMTHSAFVTAPVVRRAAGNNADIDFAPPGQAWRGEVVSDLSPSTRIPGDRRHDAR